MKRYESVFNESNIEKFNIKVGSIIKFLRPGESLTKVNKATVIDINSTGDEDFFVVNFKGETINVSERYIAQVIKY